MPVSPADLPELSRLLDEALLLDADQREGWLAALPETRQHLLPVLQEMLAQARGTDASGLLSSLPSLDDPDDAVAHGGELVGPYRLIRPIGEGGMGTVWLAERADGAFTRQVALKLPRLAWGAGLVKRMARERDIGAMLEHPNIARLYDAGVDGKGRPYMALEYIDGVAIDVWCQDKNLPVRDKLQLMVQVAKAVAYAHGRLIVHRDLKPSNVLVSADGQVHLLDFGIARLLEQDRGGEPITQELSRVLTPSYAAPEQLEGKPVTVASDVYSLGVMTYELLTGALPHQPKRMTLGALEEAILLGDAALASTRTSVRTVARELRGDIDAILGKALKADSVQRYATADALAHDLERHLRGEPVIAQSNRAAYRLGKMMRRHWLGVATSAGALVAVQGGAGVAIVLSHRAAESEQRERLARELVAQILQVGARPMGEDRAIDVTATQVFLERSAKLVQERLAEQPEVQADLYAAIGQVFEGMGASRLSCEYGRLRVEALERAGADDAQRAQASLDLANVLLQDADIEGVRRHAHRARKFANGDPDTDVKARALLARALWEQGKLARAGGILDELERRPRSLSGVGAGAAAHALWARARWLESADRSDEAAAAYDSAIAQAVAAEGQASLTAARIRLDAAFDFAFYAQRCALTDKYLHAAVGALWRIGGQHRIRAALEFACITARRYPDQGLSFDAVRSAIAWARVIVADAPYSIPADVVLPLDMTEGNALRRWGNVEAAEPLIERCGKLLFEAARRPGARLQAALPLGVTFMRLGRHHEADHWLRESFRARIEDGTGGQSYAAMDHILLAMNLRMMGRLAEAERVLAVAPRFPAGQNEALPGRYNLLLGLAASDLALHRGAVHQALQRFPMGLIDPPGLASPSVDDSEARFLLGSIQCELGRLDEGLVNLRTVLGRSEDRYEHRPELAYRRAVAGRYALRSGDRKRAMTWAKQARESFTTQPHVSDYYKTPLRELEAELRTKATRAATR